MYCTLISRKRAFSARRFTTRCASPRQDILAVTRDRNIFDSILVALLVAATEEFALQVRRGLSPYHICPGSPFLNTQRLAAQHHIIRLAYAHELTLIAQVIAFSLMGRCRHVLNSFRESIRGLFEATESCVESPHLYFLVDGA